PTDLRIRDIKLIVAYQMNPPKSYEWRAYGPNQRARISPQGYSGRDLVGHDPDGYDEGSQPKRN
ncbi:MAG: hypothetical protein KDA68_10155, partial [Planctomycetaceae bacterium]|nr:hypothetical protein [Planctomycetaceae bacterium]